MVTTGAAFQLAISARGRAVFPEAELKRVFLPRGLGGTYRLARNLPGEP